MWICTLVHDAGPCVQGLGSEGSKEEPAGLQPSMGAEQLRAMHAQFVKMHMGGVASPYAYRPGSPAGSVASYHSSEWVNSAGASISYV